MSKLPRVLFIHRSVGFYLIRDGKLRELIAADPIFSFSDYMQNSDVLTDDEGNETKAGFTFPGGDTKPEDYAQIFTKDIASAYKPIRDLALSYDVIVIKSCYPNNNIKSAEQLKTVQQYYLSIAKFFEDYPSKKLIILTSPPLTPLMTTLARAKRAVQLADWLAGTNLGTNTTVFNFFGLLTSKTGWLKWRYRRVLPVDSHPNARADREIAPLFLKFLSESV